jgi:hypothetical protein
MFTAITVHEQDDAAAGLSVKLGIFYGAWINLREGMEDGRIEGESDLQWRRVKENRWEDERRRERKEELAGEFEGQQVQQVGVCACLSVCLAVKGGTGKKNFLRADKSWSVLLQYREREGNSPWGRRMGHARTRTSYGMEWREGRESGG